VYQEETIINMVQEYKPKNSMLSKIFGILGEITDRIFWIIIGIVIGAGLVIVATLFL